VSAKEKSYIPEIKFDKNEVSGVFLQQASLQGQAALMREYERNFNVS